MTRGPVLHEDGAPGHPHARLEMLVEDRTVHLGVHLLVLVHKVELPKLPIPEASPYHQFWGMLHGATDEPRVVTGVIGGSAHPEPVSEASPQLDMSLVAPQDLPPSPLAPRPLPLGPEKAADLLRVGQEGLDGGNPRGDGEIRVDDFPDGGLVNLLETGNLPLKACRSKEGVLVQTSLDPLLHPLINLPIVSSRPRILTAGSGTGKIAVPGLIEDVPGPGGLGLLLPSPQGAWRDVELGRDLCWRSARLQHSQCTDSGRVAAMLSRALLLGFSFNHG